MFLTFVLSTDYLLTIVLVKIERITGNEPSVFLQYRLNATLKTLVS